MLSRIFFRLRDAWAVLLGRKAVATPMEYPIHVAITYTVTEGNAPANIGALVRQELRRAVWPSPPS